MTDDLETRYPELFEAARFLRERAVAAGGSPSDVRLRCITDADGNVIAGKLPPPDPPQWVQIELAGGKQPWHPRPLTPEQRTRGYRGRSR